VRTISRAKVPHTHTYPIGAEALARLLGSCAAASTVRFECYPIGLQTEGFAYRIISLECGTPDTPFAASGTAVTRGDFAPRSEFIISVVKRELKSKVHQLLRDVAIGHFQRWLVAHPNAAQDPLQRIDFYFDEKNGNIMGPNPGK
jgi:hypothetical protein